ncbi:hypothetical protein [Acinetobacter ursingii]|uniref:hypothetical protein n=1 Tax=Acinetobacter ursingii TaxID=108980 RepID=UPI001250BB8C|nr:hypothetical protein [Acinetobacter ursingii]
MNNCKIRVNNEAESREAQELFFELGYRWNGCGSEYSRIGNYTFITAYPDEMLLRMGWGGDTDDELTLPQLRDLVVLKRNDINDANWETEGGDQIFNDSNNKSYIYRTDGWDELQRHEMRQAMWEKSKAIAKPQDPALISGADALRALADGKEVEYLYGTQWESATGNQILISAFIGDKFKFRIKPQTIKIELEIPKPFLPKDGDMVWFISRDNTCGYSHDVFGHGLEEKWIQYGAWRTKEEIKIVVEQLRKLKEHSK